MATGRLELLDWLNNFLETDFPKLEYLSDGIAYCQLFDAILPPGTVPLTQLDFNATFPDDRARNLKILDDVFHKMGIGRSVPVAALAKGRFQDNKDFLKWCYDFMQSQFPDGLPSYPAFHKRTTAMQAQVNKKNEGDVKKPSRAVSNNLLPNNVPLLKSPEIKTAAELGLISESEGEQDYPQRGAADYLDYSNASENDVIGEAMKEINNIRTEEDNDAVHRRRGEELQRLIASLEHELQDRLVALSSWSQSLNGLLQERDFYYSKLREIELLCTDIYPDSPFANSIVRALSKDVPGFKVTKR